MTDGAPAASDGAAPSPGDGGWHQSSSATSGLTNYDLRVSSQTARRRGRRARSGESPLLLATDFKKVNGMDTQLDLMLKALAKSVSSILDAPVQNRRQLLQKTCLQFREAAVDYIQDGLEKAYSAGEGSALAKRLGKRLAKGHGNVQAMASILEQTETLMGNIARTEYNNPEMLQAVQSWLADGSVLLSDMAGAGAGAEAAMAPEPAMNTDNYALEDAIEEEIEKFTRNVTHRLRKQAEADFDYDFDDEDDDDEDDDEDEAIEKYARAIAEQMYKAVGTAAEDIPDAAGILDNDLDFDLDDDPDQDNPRFGDMVSPADTSASQTIDDDEVTGHPTASPNLEAEVEKFARALARRMRKAVDTAAEKIPDAGQESDNDLDFDLDEDPDEDSPRFGDMTQPADPHAGQTVDDDEVTGHPTASPNLEAEVEKYARAIVRKMSRQTLAKNDMPPMGGDEQMPQPQPEMDLDSPEVIGRLSAAIFEEAAKMKGATQDPEAEGAGMMNQAASGGGQPFQKMAGAERSQAFQRALNKAAQNVLGELRKTPAPAKGVVRKVVSKTDDANDLAKSYGIDLHAEAERLEKLDPDKRAAELIKFAHRNPRSFA